MASKRTRKADVLGTDSSTARAATGTKDPARTQVDDPQSLTVANKGIRTGQDFADLMSSLMADVIAGRVAPATANAACNAGGKLLKVVEMQYKYGKPSNPKRPDLVLTSGGI